MEMETEMEKIKVKRWRIDKKYKRYQEDVVDYQRKAQERFSRHGAIAFLAFGFIFGFFDKFLWQEFETDVLFCFGISLFSTTNYILNRYVFPKYEKWIIPAGNIYMLILGKILMAVMLVDTGTVSWTLALCSLVSTSMVIMIPYYYAAVLIAVLGMDMIDYGMMNPGMINMLYHFLGDLIISAFCIGTNIIFSNMKYQELERKETLDREIKRDPLTRLYNRRYLEHFFSTHTDADIMSAVLMIDLDNFKMANDVYGHKTGDEVLCQVAAILKKHFRESDCVARIGGDEFVVYLPQIKQKEPVVNRVNQLLDRFPIVLQGERRIEVSASIGVVFKDEGETASYEQLCEKADEAMYKAKKSGKAKVVIAA